MRPTPFLDECGRRFDSMFTIRLPGINRGTFVFVTSPELIKQIFTADPAVLCAGRANRVLEPVVGSHSVLLLDGDEHLRQRRLLLPPFHGERMHSYGALMRDITSASLAHWPVGERFAVHPHMQAITLSVILRSVFGLAEGAQMHALRPVLEEYFTPPPAFMAMLNFMQVDVPLSPYRRFLRRRAAVDRELYRIIRERRAEPDLAEREDILSMLLTARDEAGQPMSDVELRDELLTMLAAGHETTATALSWAFARILDDRAIYDRLMSELDALGRGPLDPAALPKLEYLDAVVKETLRLKPILPLVVRETMQPYSIGGWELPPAIGLAPCIYLTQRRADIYPDPEQFKPERFLGAKIDPYAWLPFGGGIRRCVGMAFALYEMKIVLATVLRGARLRLAAPVRTVRRTITLAPSQGTLVERLAA
jgi:cytochrome P450